MSTIRPRYEVHKLDGEVDHEVFKMRVDDDGKPAGGFESEIVKEDAGWMVYFPSGASIRVRTKEELKRLGFDKSADLVDMDSGDIVGNTGQVSLKSRSEQLTSRGRKTRPSIKQTADNGE
tara:strand:+ start:249 stop:608 length:360 start_codon:yes stop_codon:yes gene_type:complete